MFSHSRTQRTPPTLCLKGSPTKVVRSFTKELKTPGVIHEVDPEAAVELIVAKLKEKHII